MEDKVEFNPETQLYSVVGQDGTTYYARSADEVLQMASTAIARRTTGPITQTLRDYIRQAQDEYAHPDKGE